LTGPAVLLRVPEDQVMRKTRTLNRYSLAFKQKVVSEIESGRVTISEARDLYGISGAGTINYWMRKMGKNHLLPRIVRIEMEDEKDIIKELKKRNKELESALANELLKNIALESLLDAAGEHYGTDLKKTFDEQASKKRLKK
jgi:transposase-like protein